MRVLARLKLSGCLRSFPSRLKAPHSMPTETFAPYMFNYSSPSVKNSALLPLASIHTPPRTPPTIGRQVHIWHMVQSNAAFPPLLAWPAGTPEEPRQRASACRLAKRNRRSVANNTRTTPVMQHICQWWIFESLLTPHPTRRLSQVFICNRS